MKVNIGPIIGIYDKIKEIILRQKAIEIQAIVNTNPCLAWNKAKSLSLLVNKGTRNKKGGK